MINVVVFPGHTHLFFDHFLLTIAVSSRATDDFCRLMIIFANSLDPDHDQQNVGPDPDPIV